MRINTRVNLVFGGSGLIGKNLKKYLKNKKNFIYISKSYKKPSFFKFDLNKNFKVFPYKEIDKCFFLASPRILKKNLNKEKFYQEYKWLKKVILNIKINKIIYLSSSSVYYDKNHIIGSNKRRCENLIIKNKKKFNNFQIWRPFNLVGNNYEPSDHFHNLLFRKMFIEKKNYSFFYGNINDKRGYSEVGDFVKKMLQYSKIDKSLIKDYGNKKLLKVIDLLNLFNKYYFKINNKNFRYKFLNKKPNINKIRVNKNNICKSINSLKIFDKYLKNSINVKKLQNLS